MFLPQFSAFFERTSGPCSTEAFNLTNKKNDVSFSHVKFQVSKMKRSEVTAVSADDVFAAIFGVF